MDEREDIDLPYSTSKSISFGNGGGFTGKVKEFKLHDNGLIEKRNGEVFSSVSKIDQKLCDQVFNNIESLDLYSKRINDPGNMYYFINIRDSDMMTNFTWGGINEEADPVLKKYYKLLWDLANKKNIAKQ